MSRRRQRILSSSWERERIRREQEWSRESKNMFGGGRLLGAGRVRNMRDRFTGGNKKARL